MNNQIINPEELQSLPKEVVLLDVRTPGEFKSKHLPHAINLPLDQIHQKSLSELNINSKTPLVIVCQSGKRAEKACEVLSNLQCLDLKILAGGMNACARCNNFSFIEGPGVISLERQVRIAAGIFVLLGIVLGSMVASEFYFLSAFVGAGLVFSGITDTCGLALALGKMPWNNKY